MLLPSASIWQAACTWAYEGVLSPYQAREITEAGKEALLSGKYNVVRINYANPGRLHTCPSCTSLCAGTLCYVGLFVGQLSLSDDWTAHVLVLERAQCAMALSTGPHFALPAHRHLICKCRHAPAVTHRMRIEA